MDKREVVNCGGCVLDWGVGRMVDVDVDVDVEEGWRGR